MAPVEPPLNRRICPIHARQVGLDPSPAFYKTAELFAQPTKAANASCYNSDDYNHHRTVSGVVSPRPLDCVPRRRRNMGCYTLAGRRGIRVPSRAGARSSHRLPPPAVILAPERKGKKSTSVTRLEAGWVMSTPMDFRWTLVLVAGGEFGAEHFYCWSGARLSPVVVVVGWVTWLERRLRWLPGTTRRSSAPC